MKRLALFIAALVAIALLMAVVVIAPQVVIIGTMP
jgi:hypothetical protein